MSEVPSEEVDVTGDDRDAIVRREREVATAARSRGDHATALAHFRAALAADPDHLWSLHDVAAALLDLGRLDEAEAGFGAVRDRDPAFVHARFGLAQVARRRGDHAAAIELLHAALAVDSGHLWSLHALAAELRDLGRLDEAEAPLLQAIALVPRFYPALIGLAQIARRRGDHLRALEHFRAVLAIEPDHLWSIQDVATELLELGRLDEAEAAAREALARDPAFAPARFGLGQIARRRGDHAAAVEHFRAAVAADPRHLWALHGLGGELRDLDRFDEAETALERALTIDPRFFPARIGLAQVARRRGDHAAALEQYRAVLEIEPGHLWSLEDAAIELHALGRLEEAEAIHLAVIARDGGFAPAWYGLGRTLHRRGDLDGALAAFDRTLGLDPHHLWAVQEQAAVLCDLDRRGEAKDLLRRWIDAHPDVAPARIRLAEIERTDAAPAETADPIETASPVALDDDAVAPAEIERIDAEPSEIERIEAAPTEPVVPVETASPAAPDDDAVALAEADLRADRLDLAVGRLLDVLAAAPREAAAIDLLGRIAVRLDDPPLALLHFRRAVEIDPDSIRYRLAAARCLVLVGRTDDALADLDRLRRQRPSAPEIDLVTAAILRDCGRPAEARAALDDAVRRFPLHVDMRFERIAALIAGGEYAAAEAAIAELPDADARGAAGIAVLRGRLAAATWRPEAALAHFRDALGIDPTDGRTHDFAARAALLSLDPDAAATHLERSKAAGGDDRLRNGEAGRVSEARVGRLVDELRRDRDGLDAARAAAAAADPIVALAGLITSVPDSTPAAIGLVTALRRAGRFDRPRPAVRPKAVSPIPPRITQFWDEHLPADVAARCETWRRRNPDCAYRLYSKREARGFLAETMPPRVVVAFDRAGAPARQADLFRLALLWREGGWWADTDLSCLAAISTLEHGGTDLLLHQEDVGTVGTDLIGARPHHPVIGRALAGAIEALEHGDTDMVRPADGPVLLTRGLAVHLAGDVAHRQDEVTVLDRPGLLRIVAVDRRASHEHGRRHWSLSAFAPLGEAERDLAAARARWHEEMRRFLTRV